MLEPPQEAEPPGSEGECLGHRPADREPRVVRKQLERARSANPRELVVGLIDDDHTRCDVTDGPNGLQADGGSGGVVRAGDQHHIRPGFQYRGSGRVRIDGEVVAARNSAPLAVGVGVLGVHRVRRRERQHPPTGPGERQQHVQHHLVAAIGSPDLLGTQPVTEVTSQVATQRQRITLWVAVHRATGLGDSADLADHLLARRIRILVDVQADSDIELRRSVRRLTNQLGSKEARRARDSRWPPTSRRACRREEPAGDCSTVCR